MTFSDDIVFFGAKCLLCTVCTLLMMVACSTVKTSAKRLAVTCAAYLAFAVVVIVVMLSLFPLNIALLVGIVIMAAVMMVALYSVSEFTPWQAVFNYTMQLSFALVLMMTQTLVARTKLIDLLFRLGSFAAVIFFEWKFLRERFAQMSYLPDVNWRLLSLAPVGFYVLNLFLGTYPVHFTESVPAIISVYISTAIMLATYVIIFRSLLSQHQLQQARNTENILMLRTQALENQLSAFDQASKQMRIQRHDMRFHLTRIAELIKLGQTEEALRFIDGVDEKLVNTAPVSYCGNTTVNAVLSYYVARAQEREIRTDVSFFLPEPLAFDIIDFTAMLANALDNAIRACEAIPDPMARRITINARCKNMYILQIANTFQNPVQFDEQGLPKSDQAFHGTGVHSIAAFAEKNGASLSYSVNNDWFILRIAVNR